MEAIITMKSPPVTRSSRDRIFEAAVQLFSEQGYERTTLDQIIARAKVGKGTVYRYFKGKEMLFLELIAEIFQNLFVAWKQMPKLPDPIEDVKQMLRIYIEYFSRERAAFFIMLQHMASANETSRQFIREKIIPQFDVILDVERAWDKTTPGKRARSRRLFLSHLGLLNGFLYHHFLFEEREPSAEELEELAHLILHGIFHPPER